jgi:hypothetical protein
VYGDHTAEPIARTDEASAQARAARTVSAGTPSSGADPAVARASAARPNGWSAPARAAYRTDDRRSGAQSASVIRVNTSGKNGQVIYWHGQLPPLDTEPNGEHVVEADSMRVKGDLTTRGASWDRCHEDLMARLEDRLRQEVRRLGLITPTC